MNPMQLIQDGKGDLSSTRSILIGVALYIIAMNCAFNISALLHGQQPIPLALNDVLAIVGVLAGKVWQTKLENKG